MDTTNSTTRTAIALLLASLVTQPWSVAHAQQLRQPFLASIEQLENQSDQRSEWNTGWRQGVEQLASEYGANSNSNSPPHQSLPVNGSPLSKSSELERGNAQSMFSTPLLGTPVTNSINSGESIDTDGKGTGPSGVWQKNSNALPALRKDSRMSWLPALKRLAMGKSTERVNSSSSEPFSKSIDQLESVTKLPSDSETFPSPPFTSSPSSIAEQVDAEPYAGSIGIFVRTDVDEEALDSNEDQPQPLGDGNEIITDEDPEYWAATYRPNAVSKRLFSYGYDEKADVSATGLVDLSEPFATPHADHQAGHVPFHHGDFTPLPDYSCFGYDAYAEMTPYYDKSLNPTQRPWVELGRGMYLNGPIPPSKTWMGCTNPVSPHFLVYGDYRTAIGYVDGGNGDFWVNAHRLNLDLDLKLTATERIHAFIGPLDRGLNFTRVVSDGGDVKFEEEFDLDFDTIYFEGDLGAMLGGAMGIYPPFDMPIAFGIIPMLFQNGTWLNDNFLGAAVTIPARNSPRLQWSNFDITFFAGLDEINSDAFRGDDSLANIYGVHGFIEAYQGYLEIGYAFLDDTLDQGLGYHNIGVSFARRYGHRISNSVRFIANVGQDPVSGEKTADGQLLLIENALITKNYTSFVPYMNFFAGFGRPQSAARAGVAGGVLVNTGINFETDGLTGFPTLDATANDTAGGAVGINWLGDRIDWQLITEFAAVRTHGNDPNRNIPSDQYAFGVRYQQPISNAWLIRIDGMHGVRKELSDISGARFELRYKF